jgi:hypothetical protein
MRAGQSRPGLDRDVEKFWPQCRLEAVYATEFGTKTALDKFDHHTVPALESILIKALEKEPARRYQSARERRVDLERLSSGVVGGGVASTRSQGDCARRTDFSRTAQATP